MSVEPDVLPAPVTQASGNIRGNNTNRPTAVASADQESSINVMLRSSAHPMALITLYVLRISPILLYIFASWLPSFVLAVTLVVVLLAMDFWNVRNVAGRLLVGLRFWNQVDDDGESYWVFESRDPRHGVANKVDERMFWVAIYTFPILWVLLLFVGLLKLNLSYLPILALALIFNITNAIGFTYADRDAKSRWTTGMGMGGSLLGLGSLGANVLGGAVKSGLGRVFTSR
ncbi:DUF846-domain-containing protein [Cylindrobasidium torrendii FP15055 ss-10]|uniref:Golgi apparatus membrane protein TVP23 n=1 Tax=Cylindrobasidium torrendii FP15055 ss-10 TaxID=1314674 RepID=A0A0D7BRE3_9AGAR|nr:DUF846-domain-containing protein [Cylindrobasidium torrendii FP15055 ss-10]